MSDPPSQSSDLVQIVTALCALAGTAISGYIAYKMAQLNRKADQAATDTGVVRTTLNAANEVQTAKLDEVVAKVEQVHVATNSMKDQLIAVTEKEALARGSREERERADAAAAASQQGQQPRPLGRDEP